VAWPANFGTAQNIFTDENVSAERSLPLAHAFARLPFAVLASWS
jgi:hypothetical protein